MLRGLQWLHRSVAPRLRATSKGHASQIQFSRTITFHGMMKRQLSSVYAASQIPEDLEDSEMYEEIEIELPSHCRGCGVRLQQDNPEAPGYFQVPKKLIEMLSNPIEEPEELEEEDLEISEEETPEEGNENEWSRFDTLVESWLDEGDDEEDDDDDFFGKKKPSKRKFVPQPKVYTDQESEEDILNQILCARCYSLTHYGKVKNADGESSLPDFDFERIVGSRLALQKFRRSVVLMVVDLGDFDGSLPRSAIKSLLPSHIRNSADIINRYPPSFRLVVAANKSDLLPSQATYTRIENWVRKRMAQGGLPRPSAVHIVSSQRGSGVKGLLADLQAAVGTRGDVWVVGAQNAGKSSLINAMRSAVGLRQERKVTEAPVPGTTLGLVPVPSLLPKGCKLMDTPGVPHEYQLAAYMTAEEMKMLLPKRPLKPRTFRIAAGQSISIGGVARIDVLSCPGATMYLTAWVSDEVVCHFGKTEGAEERYLKHAGIKLTPPVGDEERLKEFPDLKSSEVSVFGDTWKESSVDIAIAGLGWVAVGLSGEAKLKVWSPPGVAITTRDAMLPDYAKDLERPGFRVAVTPGKDKKKKGKKQ